MKILFEWPRQEHYDPEQFVGGTEKWASYNYNLLREVHDVTLLVPEGKEYDFPYVTNGNHPSPYGVCRGRFNYHKFWDAINDVADDYDWIIITSVFGSSAPRRNLRVAEYAHKIVYVHHYYERTESTLPSYDAWSNHLFVISHGGKILTPNDWVMERSNKHFLGRVDDVHVLSRTRHTTEELLEMYNNSSHGVFNGYFDVIHHLHDAAPIQEKCDPTKVVWIGRANKEKGFPTALKTAMILEERGYDFHFFVRNDDHNNEDWIQLMDYVDQGATFNVWLNLDHSKIMREIADAHILLWTTNKETVGLVGYEAACHGLKVVYHLDQPECYLGDWGFRYSSGNPKKLAQFVNDVAFEEHDRVGQAEYFREKYTCEHDLTRWDEVLVPRTK